MSSGATGASSGSGSRWPARRGQHGKQPIEIVVHRSADEDPASHAFGEARRGDCDALLLLFRAKPWSSGGADFIGQTWSFRQHEAMPKLDARETNCTGCQLRIRGNRRDAGVKLSPH